MADSISEKGQENVLIIPDYKISIVTSFIEMIYTGYTWVERETDFEEMKQFGFKLLGFFMGLNMNVKLEKERTSKCTLKLMQQTLPAIEKQQNIQITFKTPSIKKSEQLNCSQDEVFCKHGNLSSTIIELPDNPSKNSQTEPLKLSSYLEMKMDIDINNIYKDTATLSPLLKLAHPQWVSHFCLNLDNSYLPTMSDCPAVEVLSRVSIKGNPTL